MINSEGSVAKLGAIVTGALMLQLAGTIVNTVVPIRMAMAGEPPLMIGAVGSSYSVGFVIGCFTIPGLVRRIGHIRGFAVFAALQAAATLGLPLMAEAWWGVPRLLMGLCAAALGICIESWISGQAKGSQRGRVFGVYQILNRLALIGSQIGVGYVSFQTQDVFLYASMLFSLALIPVGMTRAKSPETSEVLSVRLRTIWQQAPAGVVGCLYVGLMGGPLTAVAPAYGVLIGLNQRHAILLTAAVQIGALMLQWPAALLADRVPSRLIMLAGASIATLSSALLTTLFQLGPGLSQLWLFVLFGLIGGSSMPLYTVAVTHTYFRMGPDQAVGLSSRLLFLWAAGSTLGPLAATAVMQLLGPQGLLIYMSTLSAAVAGYVALRISRKPSPAMPERSGGTPVMPDIGAQKG